MDKKRILELADLIEAQPHARRDAESGFNMNEWAHDCGTPSCIWGWSESMRLKTNLIDIEAPTSHSLKYLGITGDDGMKLFTPSSAGRYDDITPAHAAAVLRFFAKTGDVNWGVKP